MPPDKVFIDENWLKTAPRPPKTSLKDKDYNKRVHHIRDSSLGGFGVMVYADGSAKAFINAKFKDEPNARKRDLGYITKTKGQSTEDYRLLVKDIKAQWAEGIEHKMFEATVAAETQTLAAKIRSLLEKAPELKEQSIKPKFMSDKRITIFEVKTTGKVKDTKAKPIYSLEGKGIQTKTLKNYFSYWNNHVATSGVKVKVGDKKVAIFRCKVHNITAEAMRDLHNEITKKGQRVNADKVLGWLRSCFESFKVKPNPVIEGLSAQTGLFSRSVGSKWNKETVKEDNIQLDKKEAKKIRKTIEKRLEKLRNKNDRSWRESKEMRTLVLLLTAMFTGGRFDWVCALKWEQLDHKDFVTVNTKNRDRLKVILEELGTLCNRYLEPEEDNDYVFWSNEAREGYIVDYKKLWKQILTEANVPWTKPKALRKHYNQRMIELGYNETTRKIALTQSPKGVNEANYSMYFKDQVKYERETYKAIAE